MMKFLKWWMGVVVVFWCIYAVFYAVSDDEQQAVEKVTLTQLVPSLFMQGSDPVEKVAKMKAAGLDTDMALMDALHHSPRISHIQFKTQDLDDLVPADTQDMMMLSTNAAASKPKDDMFSWLSGERMPSFVTLSFDVNQNQKVEMIFMVKRKSLTFPIAKVYSLTDVSINNHGINSPGNRLEIMSSLFYKKPEMFERVLNEYIQRVRSDPSPQVSDPVNVSTSNAPAVDSSSTGILTGLDGAPSQNTSSHDAAGSSYVEEECESQPVTDGACGEFVQMINHYGGVGVVQDRDGFVNLRDAPGTQGKIIARVGTGEKVHVDEIVGKWARVSYDGTKQKLYGYISADRLDISIDQNMIR